MQERRSRLRGAAQKREMWQGDGLQVLFLRENPFQKVLESLDSENYIDLTKN